MGTSASSKGPGSGVPLIPPWVDPVATLAAPLEPDANEAPPAEEIDEEESTVERTENHPDTEQTGEGGSRPPQDGVQRIAPFRRFGAARKSLGQFAQSGDRSALERGLGHYVRSGIGGASTGSRRMGGTARTAGALYNALDGLRRGEAGPGEFGLDRGSLVGRSATEVGEKITEAIAPNDGTQDREAQRDSIARAVSELVSSDPNADLLALTPEQIDFLISRFVAEDLCRRIELDIGKALFAKADPATAVRRSEEMRSFIREQVFACFRARATGGQGLTRSQAAELCAGVIKDTLSVFEDYIK